jgi:hypothetical protein
MHSGNYFSEHFIQRFYHIIFFNIRHIELKKKISIKDGR